MYRYVPLLLLLACAPVPSSETDVATDTADSASEACTPVNFYADADQDGFGNPGIATSSCTALPGTVADASDCDDSRSDLSPLGTETCNGLDDNCDGSVDNDAPESVQWHLDADADGYGDPQTYALACEAPVGFVSDATDCDDFDPSVHPLADESDCDDPVDYNCDGSVARVDSDGDGWSACKECDDSDPNRFPSHPEVCDGETDEDCDGWIDDDDDDVIGTSNWYRDADGDSYGNDELMTPACEQPYGFVDRGGDCDDADSWRSPDRTEVCDIEDLDEDCTFTADDQDVGTDPATFQTFAKDADGDGYGNGSRSVVQCDAPTGYVVADGDCDDSNPDVSPGEPEICDAADNNCNSLVDDDDPKLTGATIFYADYDADGWGNPSAFRTACSAPPTYVTNNDDCDDADASVPDAQGSCGETAGDTADSGGTSVPSPSVRFVVIGDTGDGSLGQYEVAFGMKTVCAAEGCDFALLTGDNFYPGGVASTADPLWQDAFEQPYSSIGIQFWATMGNHDWNSGNDPALLQAQIDYTSVSRNWYFPADYYSRVSGDITFYSIDSHLIDIGGGAPQEAWLPSERASSTTTWNIAWGHHPYISNGPHGNTPGNFETFFDSYICGQFDVYFSGHDHNLQWPVDSCGTELIVSGAGHSTYPIVGTNPTYFEAEELGFVWVEIDGRDFTAVFYDQAANELYRQTFTK